MVLKSYILVLSLILWAGMTFAQEQQLAENDPIMAALIKHLQETTYHALLIGIDDYEDGSGISDLINPVSDATKLANLLISYYNFNPKDVKILRNSDRSEIIEEFELLAKRVSSKDNVLVFYAGHGKWVENIKQGYWLPSDAKITTKGNWISNDDIRDYIKNIPSKHTLLISDACFSGGLLRTVAESREILELYNDKSRKVLSSGNLETVPDRSVFIEYLIKELRENRKHFISADQLHNQFRAAVINNSPTHQKPLYGAIHEAGDEGGEFIFLRLTNQENGQSPNEVVSKNPSLGRSETIITYGSIELTTEVSGALYLDGKLMGNVSSNSKTPINEVSVGTHTVKIVGSKTQTREITVYKDRATTVIFEKEKEDHNSAAGTSFTDYRDSKTYKWVRIGTQVWMAENLEYTMPGSYVNKNGDRLYTWEAAMQACRVGWHLPSDKEWDLLINNFGGAVKAGAALKSTSGWKDVGNGTNSSGFTGLPAGFRGSFSKFVYVDEYSLFWSSTEESERLAWVRVLNYDNSEMNRDYYFKVRALSCRCVRDN